MIFIKAVLMSSSKGLTIDDIKKYVGVLFKKGVSFEEFDINNGIIEIGDICKKHQNKTKKRLIPHISSSSSLLKP